MKKSVLFISVLFITLISCSKDDSPTITEPVNNFANTKWELKSTSAYAVADFFNDTECKIDITNLSGDIFHEYFNYTFIENTAILTGKETGTFFNTVTLTGDKITFSSNGSVFTRMD